MGIFDFIGISIGRGKELTEVRQKILRYQELAEKEPGNAEIKATIGDLHLRVSMIESASKYYREAITIFLREDNHVMPLNILKKLLLFNFHDLTSFENILISGGLKEDIISMYLNIDQKSLAANTLFATDILQRVLRIDPDNAAALALLKKEGILPEPKATPAASGEIVKIEEMRDKTDLQSSYDEGGNSRLSEMVNEKVQENTQLAAEVLKLQDNVTTLSERLSEQEELLKHATAEYEREKEEALAGLRNEYRLSEEKYETDGRLLQEEIGGLKSEIAEYEMLYNETDSAKKALEERLSEVTKELSELDSVSQQRGQELDGLGRQHQTAIAGYTAETERLTAEIAELKGVVADKEGLIGGLTEEIDKLPVLEGGNSRLSEMVNEKVQENTQLAAEVSKLQDNVTTLSGRLSEQEELLKNATAAYEREKEEALAGLRNEYRLSEEKYETDGRRLQGKIEELITEANDYARRLKEAEQGEQYSKEKLQEIIDQYSDLENRLLSKVHDMSEAGILVDAEISPLTAENEDIRRDLSMQDEGVFREEPAVAGADGEMQLESATPIITNRAFGIERRWLYYAGAFCFFIVIVLAGLTVKGRYSDRQKSVSYEALFESLTRTYMADSVKVQATLVTHSLLSNGKAEKNISKYDFKKSYYLRISINSQKRSLEPGLLKNPLESLRIQEGKQNVLSASDITIDEVKTVYRRNEPVLLFFLCSFPRNKVARDAKDLIFVLKYGSVEIPLVWDSRTLKTNAGDAF